MKKSYNVVIDGKYFNESEDYMKYLMCEDVLIINNGWWNKDWPKDRITVAVVCNDIFAWGCADAEEVLCSELETVAKAHLKDPMWGITAWCISKRKERPQKPVEDRMVRSGYDIDALISGDISSLIPDIKDEEEV